MLVFIVLKVRERATAEPRGPPARPRAGGESPGAAGRGGRRRAGAISSKQHPGASRAAHKNGSDTTVDES